MASISPERPAESVILVRVDIPAASLHWEELAEHFEPWLGRYLESVRELSDAHAGREVRSEGDTAVIAFATSAQALRFALQLQEAMGRISWPPGIGELEVRIGIDRGPLSTYHDRETGRTVSHGAALERLARLARCGHGGQILLTG
ncbi:MAG: adenylate/guanylate cyclase domain-containing protein [Planctomycetota bacterium]